MEPCQWTSGIPMEPIHTTRRSSSILSADPPHLPEPAGQALSDVLDREAVQDPVMSGQLGRHCRPNGR